jgi:hypothetical protein
MSNLNARISRVRKERLVGIVAALLEKLDEAAREKIMDGAEDKSIGSDYIAASRAGRELYKALANAELAGWRRGYDKCAESHRADKETLNRVLAAPAKVDDDEIAPATQPADGTMNLLISARAEIEAYEPIADRGDEPVPTTRILRGASAVQAPTADDEVVPAASGDEPAQTRRVLRGASSVQAQATTADKEQFSDLLRRYGLTFHHMPDGRPWPGHMLIE